MKTIITVIFILALSGCDGKQPGDTKPDWCFEGCKSETQSPTKDEAKYIADAVPTHDGWCCTKAIYGAYGGGVDCEPAAAREDMCSDTREWRAGVFAFLFTSSEQSAEPDYWASPTLSYCEHAHGQFINDERRWFIVLSECQGIR